MASESDITILAKLSHALDASPQAGQRELAVRTDLSLGMMNAVLKRFVKKGWVMANRLSAKKICYMLTPEGIKAVTERTASYMRRTFAAVRQYSAVIEAQIAAYKEHGYTGVMLCGESDAAFLFEYVCRMYDMTLLQYPDVTAGLAHLSDTDEKILLVTAEPAGTECATGCMCTTVMELLHGAGTDKLKTV